jgi:hypothetical protein
MHFLQGRAQTNLFSPLPRNLSEPLHLHGLASADPSCFAPSSLLHSLARPSLTHVHNIPPRRLRQGRRYSSTASSSTAMALSDSSPRRMLAWQRATAPGQFCTHSSSRGEPCLKGGSSTLWCVSLSSHEHRPRQKHGNQNTLSRLALLLHSLLASCHIAILPFRTSSAAAFTACMSLRLSVLASLHLSVWSMSSLDELSDFSSASRLSR